MTKYYTLRWVSDFAISAEKRPIRVGRGLRRKAPYAPQWHPSFAIVVVVVVVVVAVAVVVVVVVVVVVG